MTLPDIDLVADAPADEVVEVLRRYGIAVLRGAAAEPLPALCEEFGRAFEAGAAGVDSLHGHPTNPDGRVARSTTRNLDPQRFPATRSLWLSARFREIAELYYAPHAVLTNEHLFFTHELPSLQEILPWHFDREQSLKFWVYLSDCDASSGAFEYAPGSHREGHLRANYHLLKGLPQSRIPNDIPADEVVGGRPIEGAAGDLVIFDADGFHKGGRVEPGRERRVVRGHSHPQGGGALASLSGRLLWRLHRLWSPVAARVERRIGERARSGATTRPAAERRAIRPGIGGH